jgi:aspartate/tyrosine/aromatic aminotransferase
MVQSNINEAPLDITDNNVFTDVVQALLFGDKSVFLKIKALVDVETETALGAFAIRKIPAEGEVPVKRR